MRRAAGIVLIAAIAVLAACAGPVPDQRPPDWVSGDAGGYPAPSWLLGRGSAGTLEEASDRARAELAPIFEVEIEVDSSDVQVFERRDGANGENAEQHARLVITRSIDTHSRKVIRGASIAETWQDPETGTWHALATLSRPAAAMALRDDIDALDEATQIRIRQAREAPDLLGAIAAAQQAVESQVERAAVQRMLQVIDPAGHGVARRWELSRLRADRDALLTRMTISPEARGEDSGILSRALTAGVSEAGFRVDHDHPHYHLIADLDLEDLGRQDGWFWSRGILEISLRDPEGIERGNRRWEVKASAQDSGTAHRRAVDEAASILQLDLRLQLLDFARRE